MANTEICLRAGWIYHQKCLLGKSWHKVWVTIATGGTLSMSKDRDSTRRSTQTYDLRRDCMYVWTASQCRHVVPPADMASDNLIELLLTGDRRVALCAMTQDELQLWYRCIEAARSEPSVPAPVTDNNTREGDLEEDILWCCICSRPSSKVKAIDYRPSSRMQQTSLVHEH